MPRDSPRISLADRCGRAGCARRNRRGRSRLCARLRHGALSRNLLRHAEPCLVDDPLRHPRAFGCAWFDRRVQSAAADLSGICGRGPQRPPAALRADRDHRDRLGHAAAPLRQFAGRRDRGDPGERDPGRISRHLGCRRAAPHLRDRGDCSRLGGALVALAAGHIDPDLAYWTTSGEFVFVAILSGTGHVAAPCSA